MFLLTELTAWQRGFDSNKRVHARDIFENGYRLFLINPNRIVDLKVDDDGSMFLFSDNHRDRRENLSFVRSNSTVAEVIAQHDVAFHSKFITLGFYPKNNPHKTPVDTTLDVEDIAYFDDYNDPDHPNCVWVVYCRKGFRRVEQLVEGTLEGIEDRLRTGTTSSTTTTSDREQ
jgi:hypothetical protein